VIDVINLQKSFGDKEILKGINVTSMWQSSGNPALVKVHFYDA